jgi:nucleotide-binding universal stress UspA family protein
VEQSGDPVRGILHAIEEEQPDLVVIAKTEETGLTSLSERSITDELLRESRVPVRVVSANHGGATEP